MDAEALVEDQPLVLEADGHVSFHMKSAFVERAGQHGVIDGLQQPGSQIAMDVNRDVDDAFGNVVEVAHCAPWAPGFSASPRDPVTMPIARRATIIIPLPL